MSTIIADPALRNWLGQLKEVTEIQDANGHILGTFTPNRIQAEEQARYQKLTQLIDPAEIARTLRDERDKGIPLAEFWKQMEAKYPS